MPFPSDMPTDNSLTHRQIYYLFERALFCSLPLFRRTQLKGVEGGGTIPRIGTTRELQYNAPGDSMRKRVRTRGRNPRQTRHP